MDDDGLDTSFDELPDGGANGLLVEGGEDIAARIEPVRRLGAMLAGNEGLEFSEQAEEMRPRAPSQLENVAEACRRDQTHLCAGALENGIGPYRRSVHQPVHIS